MKTIILFFIFLSFNVYSQEEGPSKNHHVIAGVQVKTHIIEGIVEETNEKATVTSSAVNEYMLQYMWRMAGWIEFRTSYRYGQYNMKKIESEFYTLNPDNNNFILTEAKAGLWLKSGRQSSFLFEFISKDDMYFIKNVDDATIIDFDKEKVNYTSVMIEQIMYGVRTQGFGFRLNAELKASGADDIIRDRTSYGMQFFFRVNKEGHYLDLYAGGTQTTKVTDEFNFSEKSTFGGLNFGINF